MPLRFPLFFSYFSLFLIYLSFIHFLRLITFIIFLSSLLPPIFTTLASACFSMPPRFPLFLIFLSPFFLSFLHFSSPHLYLVYLFSFVSVSCIFTVHASFHVFTFPTLFSFTSHHFFFLSFINFLCLIIHIFSFFFVFFFFCLLYFDGSYISLLFCAFMFPTLSPFFSPFLSFLHLFPSSSATFYLYFCLFYISTVLVSACSSLLPRFPRHTSVSHLHNVISLLFLFLAFTFISILTVIAFFFFLLLFTFLTLPLKAKPKNKQKKIRKL